jgi:LysM repeat protein
MKFNVKFTTLAISGSVIMATVLGGGFAHAAGPANVTVNPGDTLSSIATANETTYQRLFDANPNVANPDVIDVGWQIRVPAPDEQLAHRELLQAASAVAPAAPVAYQAPAATSYQQTAPQQAAAPAPAAGSGGVWDSIAQCESGGNWAISTGNGYSGGLQFSPGTWAAYGDGSASAAQASKQAQIAAAEKVLAAQGWGAWPSCSAQAGLR